MPGDLATFFLIGIIIFLIFLPVIRFVYEITVSGLLGFLKSFIGQKGFPIIIFLIYALSIIVAFFGGQEYLCKK